MTLLGLLDNLFGRESGDFIWATGIEDTFISQTRRLGERMLDEYALTQHYRFWKEDLDLASSLGVRAIRYGIPWYKVNPEPDRYDWRWLDQVLDYAVHEKSLIIIADLVHYGTPLWLDNEFLNASYPTAVAAYAKVFASRYQGLINHYTPLNEPMINAEFCGERGIWPPYLCGDDGLVKILNSLCKGIIASVQAIREVNPGAIIVQVEASSLVTTQDSTLQQEAEFYQHRVFAAGDLIGGLVEEGHPLHAWLLTHGVTRDDLRWYRENRVEIDVLGINYYPETSVQELYCHMGAVARRPTYGGADGLAAVARAFHARYNCPMFISETSTNGGVQDRVRWLHDSIAQVRALRQEGVPVVGYCWWPLYDLVDWVYRAGGRPVEDFIACLGPKSLDADQVCGFLRRLGWRSLGGVPLEACIAPMGLWALEMEFDGTLRRVRTEAANVYAEYVARGSQAVGEIVDLSLDRGA